jgi:hypothetical protein
MADVRFPFRGRLGVALLFAAATGCGGFDPAPPTDGEDVAAAPSSLDISVFQLPPSGLSERAAIVGKYSSLDPTGVVPRGLLEDAIAFFDINKPYIPKQASFVVVDFAPYSGEDRFFLVDLATGAVEPHKVAHGDGTDPDNDGYADYFSNTPASHMSSLGFYLTGEIYDGTHPHSMRIDGLSPDGSPNEMANSNVRDRLIVVHEASYVSDANTSQQGRSNGCFALDPAVEKGFVNQVHDGTLMYAATSPLNAPVGAGGGAGVGGSGGGTSSCSPPECSSCSDCYDQCLCTTGNATQCAATCGGGGTGGASGGAAGAGGAQPSSCAAPECSGCATCYEQCVCEGADDATCSQTCANEPDPPAAQSPSPSHDSATCGAASVVGSDPATRSSGVFLAALALGLCGWRRRRR